MSPLRYLQRNFPLESRCQPRFLGDLNLGKIAVEPFPKNFNLAEKNIIENHLKDKVFLEKCILTDKEGMNKIDSEYAGTQAGERSNPKSNIRESDDGVEVPMHTLGYLVQKYDLKGASMKIDCEGCEYKIILTSTNEILQRFHNIFIEYHDGYKSLENKLIESGFTVNIHSRVESKMGFMTAIKKSS